MMSNVTAIIKTFLRDSYMMECVRSLKEKYPNIKIFVYDDGIKYLEKDKFMKRYVDLYVKGNFDTALTKARNDLLAKVETPYFLVGDDDFWYKDTKKLDRMVKLLKLADIVGGTVKQAGEIRHYEGFYNEKDGGLEWEKLKHGEVLPVYEGLRYHPVDFTFNFFVAKTEIRDKVKWDENIKVAYEHSDFFLNAKKSGLKVLYTPDVIVEHKPEHVIFKDESKEEYDKYRMRKSDRDYALKKWGYKYYKDINGHIDKL